MDFVSSVTMTFRRVVRTLAAILMLAMASAGPIWAVTVPVASIHEARFEERTDPAAPGRVIASATVSDQPRMSLAAPPDGAFGGGYVATQVSPWEPFRVQWDALGLAHSAEPGVAVLHSRVMSAAQVFEDTPTPFRHNHGIWAGIRGRLKDPSAAQDAFVSFRLSGQALLSDWDFNTYENFFVPVEIMADFTGSAVNGATAGTFSFFRYLNPERTEFEAFGLSMLPDFAYSGLTGFFTDLQLDLLAGPGVEVSLIGPPAGVRLPDYGGGTAPIPEPGSMALLSLGALAALAGLRRTRIA